MRGTLLVVVTVVTAAAAAPAADDWKSRPGSVRSFKPIATFNVPDGTTAEIVAATPDGRTLIYSDAIGERFGKVDISNPSAPVAAGFLDVTGSPTSVAVLPDGIHAVGAVQPGRLLLIDLATMSVAAEKAVGTGVDSVAVTRIGGRTLAVLAIENEGDLPKGYVEIVRLNLADFASSPSAVVTFDDEAALTAAGLLSPDDPQPEYVDILGTRVAVTLQENNGIAVIDISDPARPRLESLFSAGTASDRPADLLDDAMIAFTDLMTSNGFEGVAVSGNGRYLVVAVQRPYRNQAAVDGIVYTRIARYDLLNETWDAFFYPLENFPGTIGLSEVALVGRTQSGADLYAVIERDNQLAFNANLKRIYTFTLDRLAPVGIADMPTAALVATSGITKTLKADLLRAFTPYEKVEGLTRTRDGAWWAVLDNDGGEFESRLLRLRD